jgi:hypothetical protein
MYSKGGLSDSAGIKIKVSSKSRYKTSLGVATKRKTSNNHLWRQHMTSTEAQRILSSYYDKENHTKADDFVYTEALMYLIKSTKSPKYMTELAWFYAEKKHFVPELKYLEMAAEYDYIPALEELGYMWYYGQHGEKDYNKAFLYFSKGAEKGEGKETLWCRYKLADMYHYGLGTQKNEAKYEELISEVWQEVNPPEYLNEPFPEIALRYAQIIASKGRKEEATKILKEAKKFLAERLSYDPFWGYISVMERIVKLLYTLENFTAESADFYDLFYLTDRPGKYTFSYAGKTESIEVTDEESEKAIRFSGKFYRNFAEFCEKAEIRSKKFTNIYDEIIDIEPVISA